jgi:hypothetical protein
MFAFSQSFGSCLFRPAVPVVTLSRFVATLMCGLTVGVGSQTRAESFTYSPVQSAARPFNLAIADRVGLAGSDSRSANFNATALPAMNSLINSRFSEYNAYNPQAVPSGFVALDPSKLKLAVAADVRVYFVGEGASFRNSLGVNTSGLGVTGGNPLLVFPDASSPITYLSSSGSSRPRSSSEPLFPGDFVEIAGVTAGANLDFFLISDGARTGTNVFSGNVSANKDRFSHAVAFAQTNNPFLLVGFEDLWGGGDKDFNDLLFAVDVGTNNWEALTGFSAAVPAPEPGLISVAVLACGAVLQFGRRRRLAASRAMTA